MKGRRAESGVASALLGFERPLPPRSNTRQPPAKLPTTDRKLPTAYRKLRPPVFSYLTPSTFSHDIAVIQTEGNTLLSVNIPPSFHTVALWDGGDRGRIEYVRRTSHGKNWMNPDEVERHIMNSSRAAKLGLELAKAEATVPEVRLAGGHWMRPAAQNILMKWSPVN